MTDEKKEHNRPSGSELSPIILAAAPTHADWTRTLLQKATHGTLCTIGLEPAGFPYGSLVNFAVEGDGSPIFLISELAEHTANLRKDGRSSLLVAEPDPDMNPLAKGRVTLLGKTERLEATPEVRECYLARIPRARYYVDFKDFHFWRLRVEAIRYIGGFGRMSWVEVAAYRSATPDPVDPIAPGILQHMNEDHTEAMVLMCRKHAGLQDVERAVMTEVDHLGFEMEATTPGGLRLVRLGFPQPVSTSDEVRQAMVALVKAARN